MMASTSLKVESGIQLLTRLTKKSSIERFHPTLFENGPKQGDFIEIYSEGNVACLLTDLICEALILNEIGGPEASVIIFKTDGKITIDYLIALAKNKLLKLVKNTEQFNSYNMDFLLNTMLKNLFFLEIYSTMQFYTSLQNLENILTKNPNISLVVFDSITAFYWDEQSFKVTKMDLYIKNIIHTIRKIVKDFKVTIIYSRPEYFCSAKDSILNLDPCYDNAIHEQVNYRIQIIYKESGTHQINVGSQNKQIIKMFNLVNNEIIWL